MSPRPYRLGQRQAATDETRARIIAAARALIMADSGFAGFTVDAVARQASVARMTVYYQFGSKLGLLEALFDDLAARGGMERLPLAFAQAEPLEALDGFIAAFIRFWSSDRILIRRLRALAALDPDLDQALRARGERGRRGLYVILGRFIALPAQPPESLDDAVDVIYTLTSFESFDALAGASRTPEGVIVLVQRLARAVLNVYGR